THHPGPPAGRRGPSRRRGHPGRRRLPPNPRPLLGFVLVRPGGPMELAVLFDLDGTLMDTLASIVEAMNEAAAELHVVPEFREDELRPTIGKRGPRQLVELRGLSGALTDAFTDRHYAHYTRLVEPRARLAPGLHVPVL